MRITSPDFADGETIPGEFAFCVPDPDSHATFGGNRNPSLAWSDLPDGTLSVVVTCIDGDVPSQPDDVNQEGREIPESLPRVDFVHWVIADLGPDSAIAAGAWSDGVTPGGKPGADGTPVEGANSYGMWFGDDPDMGGSYRGYDGPCPPWNDSILHHYVFTAYALGVGSLGLSGAFTVDDALKAMEGHVRGEASLTGIYTLNPRLT